MNNESFKRTFPCYKNENDEVIFCEKHLPKEAKQQLIINVYRCCLDGKIDRSAFDCTYISDKRYNINRDMVFNEKYHRYFSTSCFEKARDVRRKINLFTKKHPRIIIANGSITEESGFSLKDSELDPKDKSHINWWIFEEEQPQDYFKEVNIYDEL